jgi:hypothetical protein
MGNGLALEEVIVTFDRVLACRAARIVASGTGVKGFTGWKEFVAEFDLEGAVFIAGSEGTRECVPRDRFCDVVAPPEAVFHIAFEEAEAVLATDGCSEFAGDRAAADGKLDCGSG